MHQVSSDPETSYQKVRELSSKQRRDIDSALVDFMLSTHESIPLFRAYDERVRRLAIDQLAEDVDRLAGRKNDDKAQFELCETENSLVRKKIPTYCQSELGYPDNIYIFLEYIYANVFTLQ